MKKKILIIDDEPELIDAVKERLQYEGYDVFGAEDGEKGLMLFEEAKPDLTIIDIKMPKKDGYEVLRGIKKDHKWHPIIMLTALEGLDPLWKSYEQRADIYISKPVDLKKLSVTIKTLLELAESRNLNK